MFGALKIGPWKLKLLANLHSTFDLNLLWGHLGLEKSKKSKKNCISLWKFASFTTSYWKTVFPKRWNEEDCKKVKKKKSWKSFARKSLLEICLEWPLLLFTLKNILDLRQYLQSQKILKFWPFHESQILYYKMCLQSVLGVFRIASLWEKPQKLSLYWK